MDRMKIRQRVVAKLNDEFTKHHTLNVILYTTCIEIIEAICDELEPHLNKKEKK